MNADKGSLVGNMENCLFLRPGNLALQPRILQHPMSLTADGHDFSISQNSSEDSFEKQLAVVQISCSWFSPSFVHSMYSFSVFFRKTFAEPIFTCGSTWGINLDTNI